MVLGMDWDTSRQLRHAAQCSLRFLRNGQRQDIMYLRSRLELLGYNGMVESLSADEIIHGWTKAGWVKISPNGSELRLTEAGVEQFAHWEDEDALWEQGATETIKFAKRLKAGEPATNLRKIADVIGSVTLTGVHDPYTNEKALETLLKLKGLGLTISKNLRLLTAPKVGKAVVTITSFISDLNIEMGSQWELRAYASTIKPHRRFLILQDKSVVTCGLSLNNINKDEALDRIPAGNELAEYDRNFFNNCWTSATPV
jgi:hypothetical protein